MNTLGKSAFGTHFQLQRGTQLSTGAVWRIINDDQGAFCFHNFSVATVNDSSYPAKRDIRFGATLASGVDSDAQTYDHS